MPYNYDARMTTVHMTMAGAPGVSDHSESSRREETNAREAKYSANNPKEPTQSLRIFSRNIHVHTECAGDQIKRHKNCSDNRDLGQSFVGVVAFDNAIHIQLSQVIGVRSRQHLLNVAQV